MLECFLFFNLESERREEENNGTTKISVNDGRWLHKQTDCLLWRMANGKLLCSEHSKFNLVKLLFTVIHIHR